MDFNQKHLIFSVENAVHTPKIQGPTHKQALEWLKRQGEDAVEAVGVYGGNPERSIIVKNPKNISSIEQLATDIGQDSIIHSHKGNHELKYLNGANAGKVIRGKGTKVFSETPKDMFTTVKDELGHNVHFSHDLDFGTFHNPSLSKTEDLMKSPLPYTDYDSYIAEEQGLPDFMNHDDYRHVKTTKLPNGLEYRKFKHRLSHADENKTAHAIYDPKDISSPLAYLETYNAEDYGRNHDNSVSWAEVDPNHRGKGLGRQAYLAALAFGSNELHSDERISPEAHKMWQSFKDYPGLGGKISKYADKNQLLFRPDLADEYEQRHHVFVRDPKKLDFNKMFPPLEAQLPTSKLAASESSILEDEILMKAIDDQQWKYIKKAHTKAALAAKNVVDDIGHINYFNKQHKDYNSQVLDSTNQIERAKISSSAVSPKAIHKVNDSTYMAKPYHTPNESWSTKWTKHPIRGWASLTTNRLFNAANMGHLTEDISATTHQNVPIVIHKFEPGAQSTEQVYGKGPALNTNDHAKIGIMDFLTNNQDRHTENLMHVNGRPLAIDHDRNMQYFGAKPGFISVIHPSLAFQNHKGYGSNVRRDFDMFADELVDWWNKVGHNVKKEMGKNLEFIKDPLVKQHISENFDTRWEWLDDRFRNDPYQIFHPDSGVYIAPYRKPRKPRKKKDDTNSNT